ncbi:hypothetical protein PRZ48_000072 [Zasmidium cellare]|uniref:Transcription factor BYE1 n=1 Tax=Zasmidium cellare TaxID=395010 RepID=A0ABR0EXH1_ZASCE|nr:hypothetical protein PRZ48_000072 [Zasmidium cellare]
MSTEEPRRSGRATKGQHKNASSSPAPNPKPAKAAPKSKAPKKSAEPEPQDDDDEEVIRCICGNSNPKDKRAFIGCDACTVWQHNVCMGIPDEEEDVPDHYFCEECRPEEHEETIQALQRGEKIWETRNKLYQNEKKMSKSRKSKGKQGEEYRPAWLKKDIAPQPPADPAPTPAPATNGKQESNNKRKREEEPAPESEAKPAPEEKPTRAGRQDKRRKSSPAESKVVMDTDTALVPIAELPKDRQNVAQALSKIVTGDIQQRVKSGFKLPANQTAASLGEHYGARIEYALHMNHGNKEPSYKQQFMALNANLKKNAILIERLLNGSLTADELSTMSSSDLASEELQKERAAMKEALDRQAIAVEEEGPRYKQDHKGFHEIEMDGQQSHDQPAESEPAPKPTVIRKESTQAGSPVNNPPPLAIDTSQQADTGGERRPSSQQQFNMNNIWAKTANSPTGTAPRPAATHARRPSAPVPAQPNGAKDDPDIDRMLDDNDESYSPADASGSDAIVWRGKLVQASEDEVTVNARYVAGRNLSSSWHTLLPETLSIDGRLAVGKAEDYLCGLRWSNSSDVSVLALTPYDNLEPFNNIFQYFHSRERYAVVEKSKPRFVKDFYIIPVEAGRELPAHIKMLEDCNIKTPIEERMLLATIVVARAPEEPPVAADATPSQQPANGHLPPHVRQSIGGPAGSPIAAQNPSFSPSNNAPPQAGYGAPNPGGLPPNPYTTQPPPPQQSPYPAQPGPAPPNPLVAEILGHLQTCPTAQVILSQAPNIDRDRLQNLRKILEEDPATQTDFDALVAKLYSLPK